MWILLFAFLSAAGTVGTGTAEFNDKAACEAAADAITDAWGKNAHGLCVAKGTDADTTQDPAPARASGGTTAKAPTARK